MKILKNKTELGSFLAEIRNKGSKIGLIPTMGSIHNGHLSLVRRSKKEGFFSIVSIFVNPTQFEDLKDFENYPRNEESDLKKLIKGNCDALYFPLAIDLYPNGIKSKKTIFEYRDILCDKFRTGHFDGVTTVVHSLFNIVQPSAVFFGEKDFQQLKIINKLIEQNNIPLKLKNCTSIRLKNGMSLSSRYNNFTSEQKNLFNHIAIKINEYVEILRQKIDIDNLKRLSQHLLNYKSIKIDYIEIRDEDNLKLTQVNNRARLFIAFYIDNIRIIDNFKLY